MPIETDFTVKNILDCEPREFIQFGNGSYAITGLIVEIDTYKQAGIIVLRESKPTQLFALVRLDANQMSCISYGIGWILELVPDSQTWPGNVIDADEKGTVRVTPTSTNLVVGEGSKGTNLQLYNLETMKIDVGTRTAGALVQNWRIWANAASRSRLGSEPIFEKRNSATP